MGQPASLAAMEACFQLSHEHFMARDGRGRSSSPSSEKKVCLVATDKQHRRAAPGDLRRA